MGSSHGIMLDPFLFALLATRAVVASDPPGFWLDSQGGRPFFITLIRYYVISLLL